MAVEPSALGNPQFDLVCGAIPPPPPPPPPPPTPNRAQQRTFALAQRTQGHHSWYCAVSSLRLRRLEEPPLSYWERGTCDVTDRVPSPGASNPRR
jgi:hypothetical protein